MEPLDFSTVKKAGLTQIEFANLCDVTRTTANLWIKGNNQPHRFILRRIAAVLTTLARAVEAHTLPLPKESDARMNTIRLALREAAKKPQTAEV